MKNNNDLYKDFFTKKEANILFLISIIICFYSVNKKSHLGLDYIEYFISILNDGTTFNMLFIIVPLLLNIKFYTYIDNNYLIKLRYKNYKEHYKFLSKSIIKINSIYFLTIILIYSIFQNGSLSKKENYTDDVGYQNVKKKLNIDTKLIKTKKNYLKEILAIIISIVVLILNPVEDMIYYGAIMVSFALALLSIKDLVQRYNELTTRKLDQLGIRGGDESE